MSFLQPLFLWALPVALLPVLIHLIHLHRRRTVAWAATRFLLAARKLNRGYSRLRRLLILALRVLAVAALIGVICRPLAGGLLGLTGGTPDTVLVLLDRSASMQQQDLASGVSKRETGLAKLSHALQEAYRGRSRLVLIDSATRTPQDIRQAVDLAELPTSWATETSADIPAMLQDALDYITTNETGRTDIWIVSDLQAGDWNPSSGRWAALRAGFANARGVRFHLLTYPEPAHENFSLSLVNLRLRTTGDQSELVLDLDIRPSSAPPVAPGPRELPVRFLVNGTPSVHLVHLGEDGRLSLRGHTLVLPPGTSRGWGRVELPADTHPADNAWHFVFDQPPVMRSAIITDEPGAITALTAVLEAPADRSRDYRVDLLDPRRVAEINWDETALIVWQAALPAAGSTGHQLLLAHLEAGRSLLFLPPPSPGSEAFLGVSWGASQSRSDRASWWRSDSGPLANTRSGKPLPVGELEIGRRLAIKTEGGAQVFSLARVESDDSPLLVSALPPGDSPDQGMVLFLGTSVDPASSSLASDGVVLYALLHRALDAGAAALGSARQRTAGRDSLGPSPELWTAAAGSEAPGLPALPSVQRPLRAGVFSASPGSASGNPGDTPLLTALNRPATEDQAACLDGATLADLLGELDYRVTTDSLTDDSSLASEIWKTFLLLMAAALLVETMLSLPRPGPAPVRSVD